MGLVNELQESAESDDVATVLRRAVRLSSKLGRNDITSWLEAEQSGYGDAAPQPEYRVVGTSLYYSTNGYVPAGFGRLRNGSYPLPGILDGQQHFVGASIGTVCSWIENIKNGGGSVSHPLDNSLSNDLRKLLVNATNLPEYLPQLSFQLVFNSAQILDIPEQVKNRVLKWACELEAAGVTGDGATFSNAEKRLAESVTINISHSTVEQLTSSGINLKATK